MKIKFIDQKGISLLNQTTNLLFLEQLYYELLMGTITNTHFLFTSAQCREESALIIYQRNLGHQSIVIDQ